MPPPIPPEWRHVGRATGPQRLSLLLVFQVSRAESAVVTHAQVAQADLLVIATIQDQVSVLSVVSEPVLGRYALPTRVDRKSIWIINNSQCLTPPLLPFLLDPFTGPKVEWNVLQWISVVQSTRRTSPGLLYSLRWYNVRNLCVCPSGGCLKQQP